jgi:hypothetical protein
MTTPRVTPAVVAAGVAISAALALLLSKRAQAVVGDRTRQRLAAHYHVEPSADDIAVAH